MKDSIKKAGTTFLFASIIIFIFGRCRDIAVVAIIAHYAKKPEPGSFVNNIPSINRILIPRTCTI